MTRAKGIVNSYLNGLINRREALDMLVSLPCTAVPTTVRDTLYAWLDNKLTTNACLSKVVAIINKVPNATR